MCTRPCVFADHYFEAGRAVELTQQVKTDLNFKGSTSF